MPDKQRAFPPGATGTIGRATAAALLARGHEVVCLVRAKPGDPRRGLPNGVTVRRDVTVWRCDQPPRLVNGRWLW